MADISADERSARVDRAISDVSVPPSQRDSGSRLMRVARVLVGAALFALSAHLLLIWATGVGTPFFIVRDAAMEPTYHRGDLLLVRSETPSQIGEGDVIAIDPLQNDGAAENLSSNEVRRVVGVGLADGLFQYETKPDRNSAPSVVTNSSETRGVVFADLGQIGWVWIILINPIVLLAITVPAIVLLVVRIAAQRVTDGRVQDTVFPVLDESGDNDTAIPTLARDQQPEPESQYDWLLRWCDAQLGAEPDPAGSRARS